MKISNVNRVIKELAWESKKMSNTVWVVHYEAQSTSVIAGVYTSESKAEESAGTWGIVEEIEVE